jgi:hypothetical protein
VSPGSASDGALPGFIFGTQAAQIGRVMRDNDESDPKKLRPVHQNKKGSNRFEALEHEPWRNARTGSEDLDRHRHV